MSNTKEFEEMLEVVEELHESKMEALIERKQELEEEIDLYEEDYTGDLEEELAEINKQIKKLSNVDTFGIVDEMYKEEE